MFVPNPFYISLVVQEGGGRTAAPFTKLYGVDRLGKERKARRMRRRNAKDSKRRGQKDRNRKRRCEREMLNNLVTG